MSETDSDNHPLRSTTRSTLFNSTVPEYLLSMPERAVRSAAALLGGTSLIITKTLFPDFVKGSATYQIFIGNLQNFVITKIAQVPASDLNHPQQLSENYIPRKLAGTILELTGLLTMRFSPVWVFAIAGDTAAGGKHFFDRLTIRLKANGVLPEDANPQSLVDLLDSLQSASHSSARAVDTPPLTREELATVAGELTTGYERLFTKSQEIVPWLESLLDRMEQVVANQSITFEELSGVMAVNAAKIGKTGLGTTIAVGETGTQIVGEKILASYARTLDEIGRQGAGQYINLEMQPFLSAAAGHLDPERLTWTERTLLGKQSAS